MVRFMLHSLFVSFSITRENNFRCEFIYYFGISDNKFGCSFLSVNFPNKEQDRVS